MRFYRAKTMFEAVLNNYGNEKKRDGRFKTHTIFRGQLFSIDDEDELPVPDDLDQQFDELWEPVENVG
jgi:hypothetical protein